MAPSPPPPVAKEGVKKEDKKEETVTKPEEVSIVTRDNHCTLLS